MKAAGEIAEARPAGYIRKPVDCVSNTEGISIDSALNHVTISGKGDRSRTGLWKAQAPKGQLPGTMTGRYREESLRLITGQEGVILSVLFLFF